MIAFLGLALFHLAGASIRQLATQCGWGAALRSPSSAWFAIALAYAVSLGVGGVGILVGLAVVTALSGPQVSPPEGRGRYVALLGIVVLARPWVPTWWDEFVWLGKARFESLGFGADRKSVV